MSETKLRELLHDLADAVPGPEPVLPRHVAVGTRRRIATRIGAVVVAAALIAAFAITATRGFLTSDPKPVKRLPTPTPTVSVPPVALGSDLYLVDPETGALRKVLAAEGDQTNPERSPDGTRIVYQSRVGGTDDEPIFQIFLMEADGSQHQLTDVPGGAEDPSWSPDGGRIAFSGTGPGTRVYVMNADGSELRRLVSQKPTSKYGFMGAHPDWSPDGNRIVFASGYPAGLWVVSVADGALTRLTKNVAVDGDYFPEWSPEGSWIVFIHDQARPGTNGSNLETDVDTDMELVRPDGTGQHPVLDREGRARFGTFPSQSPDGHFQGAPTWSPDGRFIAFRGGHCECVYFVDIAAQKVRSLPWPNGGIEGLSWDKEGLLVNA